MLNQVSLAQLACRASNLAERLFLLKQISASNLRGYEPLTAADLQEVQQDLERLLPMVSSPQNQFYPMKRKAMGQSLRLFRWYERNLAQSCERQELLLTVHKTWIRIYEQAMGFFADSVLVQSTPHFATALSKSGGLIGCAPFLALLEAELSCIVEAAQHQGLIICDPDALIASVQQFFNQRVYRMVYPLENNILEVIAADSPLTETYHTFYLGFPVLARWLAQLCGDLIRFSNIAITRLLQNRCNLSRQLWGGAVVQQLTKLRLRQEEIQGQWTATFNLKLANRQEHQVTYYHYALDAEVGLQNLYEHCQQTERVLPHPIVCCPGYGYIAAAPRTPRPNPETFRQIGHSLALRQLVGHRGLWSRLQIGIQDRGDIPTINSQMSFVQQGFETLQKWFCDQPRTAIRTLEDYLKNTSVRLLHRSPATYLLLLVNAQKSACLKNPLAVDALFQALVDQPCPWDRSGEIAQLEVKTLWQFKALCLNIPMNRRYMLYDTGHVLLSKLPLTPLEFLARRISQQAKAQSDQPLPELSSYPYATTVEKPLAFSALDVAAFY